MVAAQDPVGHAEQAGAVAFADAAEGGVDNGLARRKYSFGHGIDLVWQSQLRGPNATTWRRRPFGHRLAHEPRTVPTARSRAPQVPRVGSRAVGRTVLRRRACPGQPGPIDCERRRGGVARHIAGARAAGRVGRWARAAAGVAELDVAGEAVVLAALLECAVRGARHVGTTSGRMPWSMMMPTAARDRVHVPWRRTTTLVVGVQARQQDPNQDRHQHERTRQDLSEPGFHLAGRC